MPNRKGVTGSQVLIVDNARNGFHPVKSDETGRH
jgi:hypothetical protein